MEYFSHCGGTTDVLVDRDECGRKTLADRERLAGVVFPDAYSNLSGELSIYAIFLTSQHIPSKVRVLIDFLVEYFSKKDLDNL